MPPSREAKAISAIDSRTQPFVNKDFVRNIQWLNNSVDTLAAYTQKLQQGVDAANQNVFEQIQGIVADLIVIFAGGQPTGIDLGDLKYIFQALGALLGVNPDTVFPLNLIEAVGNLFRQFIVPLPQFTDIIFDSVALWTERLGFSDDAVAAIRDFNDAISDFYFAMTDITSSIIPALNRLLKQIGLGFGWLDLTLLRRLVDDLRAKINQILSGPRDFLLNLLSILMVTIFKALTWVINLINPRNLMRSLGFESMGPQLAPDISDLTTIWNVGSNPNQQWVWDGTQPNPGNAEGSFRTIGNAFGKQILTQGTERCTPGDNFAFSGWLKWEGVPTHQNQWGPCIVWYAGLNPVSQDNIDAPSDRGTHGGWEQVGRNVIAPNDVDGFKIGYRCGAQVGSGTIWGGQLSCSHLKLGQLDLFSWFVPWKIFDNIPQLEDLSLRGVQMWFRSLLSAMSPLNANNIYGFIPDGLLAKVPIASLFAGQTELLMHPTFDNINTLEGQGVWIHDEGTGHNKWGSVYVDCDGNLKELYNRNIIPVEKGQGFSFRVWVRWQNLGGFTTNPIRIVIQEFSDEECENMVAERVMNFCGGTGANSGWQQMTSTYTIPQDISIVKYKLQVLETATSGRVWFDDASAKRTNLLGWNLIDSLESAWNALISVLRGWTFNLGDGLSGLFESIADIGRRFINLLPTGWFDASWLFNIFNIPKLSDISIPGLLTVVDNIANKLFGNDEIGRTHEDTAEALNALREMALDTSVKLRGVMQRINETGNGVSDIFMRTSTTDLGPNWREVYSIGNGNAATNGAAYWRSGSGTTREGAFFWDGPTFKETLTPYQEVGVVISTAGGTTGWPLRESGHVDVIVRASWQELRIADVHIMWMYTYLRFRVGADKSWEIRYFSPDPPLNPGRNGVIGSGTLPFTPSPGMYIYVLAGVKEHDGVEINDPEVYRFFVGSHEVPAPYPQPGSGWRDENNALIPLTSKGFGFGMRAEALNIGVTQQVPPNVAKFVAIDQV